MPEFKLGKCRVELQLERLSGPLAADDRQVAWQLFLTLGACPALRRAQANTDDLGALVRTLLAHVAPWPAGRVEALRPGHLGPLVAAVVELVLLPCLGERPVSSAQWQAVQAFCARLAQELAREYAFPDPVAMMPADLRAAWREDA
jgi:hypothetical protein